MDSPKSENDETPAPRPGIYGRPPELDQLTQNMSISSQQAEVDPNEELETFHDAAETQNSTDDEEERESLDPALKDSDVSDSDESISSDISSLTHIVDEIALPSELREIPVEERYHYFINEIPLRNVPPKYAAYTVSRFVAEELKKESWFALYNDELQIEDVTIKSSCLVNIKDIVCIEKEIIPNHHYDYEIYAKCVLTEVDELDITPVGLIAIENDEFNSNLEKYINQRCKWIKFTDLRPALVIDGEMIHQETLHSMTADDPDAMKQSPLETEVNRERNKLGAIAYLIDMVRFWKMWIHWPFDNHLFDDYEHLVGARLNIFENLKNGYLEEDVKEYYYDLRHNYHKIICELILIHENLAKNVTAKTIYDDILLEEDDLEVDMYFSNLQKDRKCVAREIYLLEAQGLLSPDLIEEQERAIGEVSQENNTPYIREPNGPRKETLMEIQQRVEQEAQRLEDPSTIQLPKNVVHFTPKPITITDIALAEYSENTQAFQHDTFDKAIHEVCENETIFLNGNIFEPQTGLSCFNENNVTFKGLGETQLLDGPQFGLPNCKIFGNNVVFENLTFIQNQDSKPLIENIADYPELEHEMNFFWVCESQNVIFKNCKFHCYESGILVRQDTKITLIDTILEYLGNDEDNEYSAVGILQESGSNLSLLGKSKVLNFRHPVQKIVVVGDQTQIDAEVKLEGKCVITKVGYRDDQVKPEDEVDKEQIKTPKEVATENVDQAAGEIPQIVISQTNGIDITYNTDADDNVIDTQAMGEGYNSVKVQKINSKLDLQQQFNINADLQNTNWVSI